MPGDGAADGDEDDRDYSCGVADHAADAGAEHDKAGESDEATSREAKSTDNAVIRRDRARRPRFEDLAWPGLDWPGLACALPRFGVGLTAAR